MLLQPANVLEVEGVCKRYSRTNISSRHRLRHVFWQTLRGRSPNERLLAHEFWALQDISFSVPFGHATGIIGLNGSGKTTLLRILSGQLMPDRGEVRKINSSVSMIHLGAGFQTALSGRQNIYLKGAMLGRSQAEMRRCEDEIIAFSELEEAIEAPVRTYSSGMSMRLAFSVVIFTNPQLMIVDEILSVGDFRFRVKCLEKIRQLRDNAGFVLVSHSMQDISRFCDHVLVLDKGKIAFRGTPEKAIDFYQSAREPKQSNPVKSANKHFVGPLIADGNNISEVEHYWCDSAGNRLQTVNQRDDVYVRCRFRLNFTPRNLIIGIPVWTEDGVLITGFSTEAKPIKLSFKKHETANVILKVPTLPFNPGRYVSAIAITDGPEFLYRQTNPVLNVIADKQVFWGAVSVKHEWITNQ